MTQRTIAPTVVESGRRYLLIGNPCTEGERVFPGGGYAFWPLSDSGALEPQDNRQWEVFRAFPGLASVATSSAYLEERKKGRIERE